MNTFKRIPVVLLICLLSLTLLSCKRKTEAVIDEGEEITESNIQYPTLEKSNASKFSYNDLSVGNIVYLMTEVQVKGILGKPEEIRDTKEGRVYTYNELTIMFEKLDDNNKLDDNGTYKVTMVASVSEKDTFARGLKVGDSVDDILKVYYRDEDYQSNLYISEDKTVTYGKFLYGSFTVAELDKVNTKDEISYGLVNYNGYNNLETAESYIIEFTYFDDNYKEAKATINDDFASLTFEVDSSGNITMISWFYYPEE